MKAICVSMNTTEQVLDSYLLRVFTGKLITKGTIKTVRFPEENLKSKQEWSLKGFKDFCEMTVSDKKTLKMYSARLVTKKEDKSAQ